ncbi:CBS domain-containing protein [Aestuariibacter halophilus]|uniref:CBS domain-containing protein n=1 Tax=Fluctibacter halophilus TaxID=226011 RepID=A0ABS8G9B5_9ALTE|nr:CBS domain-containing protein [Aestuariibacter halophilus]MCC2617135.1 CBS domain-containing protein [Aestuariibacter halophilus]
MHALPLYNTETIDKLAWPQHQAHLSLSSSALTIFTDFKRQMPLVVDRHMKAVELERLMKQSHVKMKLVLDEQGQFIGIVSLADLSEQEIMKHIAKGIAREDLVVEDFMQPKAKLMCFDYHQLVRSTVGDIVQTLKDSGQHHCLVLDRKHHEIRGVISVSDVARTLRLPLDIQARPSFAELSRLLAA